MQYSMIARRLGFVGKRAVLLAIVVGLALMWIGYRTAEDYYVGRGVEAAARQAAPHLVSLISVLERYQTLPPILSEDRAIIEAALGSPEGTLNERLARFAEATGADAVYLMDENGWTIAASNWGQPKTFLGQNYGFRPYFKTALAGSPGEHYAVGATTGVPGYFVSHPVADEKTGIVGVIAVKVDLRNLEANWAGPEGQIFITDGNGVIVLSGEESWRFRTVAALDDETKELIATRRQFGSEDLSPIDMERRGRVVTIGDERYVEHVAEVGRAVSYSRLKRENAALRESLRRLSGLDSILIGDSPDMRRLREDIADIALSDAPVLILGETGTGKELVARALHNLGPRSGRPFVPVNCATISLQDSSAGAGSVPGAFAEAETGTLFLDELAVCTPEVQAKLLRVIERNGTEPAPGTDAREPDFRILSASNRQLEAEVDAGVFRQDLYYRLNTVIIRIPPLRERGDDIALLYSHFIGHYAELYGLDAPEPTNEDIAALLSHDWLGNVRELRHVAERRILAWRRGRGSASEAIRKDGVIDDVPPTLREAVATFERQLVAKAIRRHGGRMDAAAEALGIGRRTLNEKIVKLGIDKSDLL